MKKGFEKSGEVFVTSLCLMILLCLSENVVKGQEGRVLLGLTPSTPHLTRGSTQSGSDCRLQCLP